MSAVLKSLQQSSILYGSNSPFLEDLYECYLQEPDSVGAAWRAYFDQLQPGAPQEFARLQPPRPGKPLVAPSTKLQDVGLHPAAAEKQAAVLRLINAYRVRGHQQAAVDPLRLWARPHVEDLDPAFHGLGSADMETVFNTGSLVAPARMPLHQILALVRQVYVGTVGSEYMHITDTKQKRWIQERLEGSRAEPRLAVAERRRVLDQIIAAEGLEHYLHRNYMGQKRFSLEGAESLIPLLDDLVLRAGEQGVKEMVIGMSHRGRLNVLVNVLGKAPCDLFEEFEGRYDPETHLGSGDVKYHKGYSLDTETPGGPVHLALAFNPSHLEIVGPVVEGSVRARQHRRGDRDGIQVLPVILHGDAAFAGQGVVMETFNMSQATGFQTGGTIHVVANNQIGFTTSDPLDSRSTLYCTDVAKMVQAPIFHVNADDPEAVVFVTRLALDFRMTFRKDVVIDLVCYRRHGHNEADEPAVTQPLMYQKIRAHATVMQLYSQRLTAEGVVAAADLEQASREYEESLGQCSIVAPHGKRVGSPIATVDWRPYYGTEWTHPIDTTVSVHQIQTLAAGLLQPPEGFELHSRVARIMEDRRRMAAGALPSDWGFAETMAYATLLADGHQVRLSGQDSGRGTFFHRHAMLYSQQDNRKYCPLQHISDEQGDFIVIDSLLSEEAVLAFEYGYATAEPDGLVIWEAQFGDFANGAQVVIDQFISSGYAKWQRLCGLVLLLPHGYEGQGPEHSSARLERYLQLCAETNIQICVPTTPAQMFHMLRRQVLRPYRRPLIVMTPKSLLRHKLSVSALDELSTGGFQTVIDDVDSLDPTEVRRIILCAGKVYYDLLEQRRAQELKDVAIIRVEQLYPFPRPALSELIAGYPSAMEVVWCQEEPQNQGAWYPSQHHFRACMRQGQTLHYVGREASASPAAGYYSLHVEQQQRLVDEALS